MIDENDEDSRKGHVAGMHQQVVAGDMMTQLDDDSMDHSAMNIPLSRDAFFQIPDGSQNDAQNACQEQAASYDQQQQQQQQHQQQLLQPSTFNFVLPSTGSPRSFPDGGARPYVRILEQPAKRARRFRYACESRSAGSWPGVSSSNDKKTYPAIQIVNYVGRAVIVVSCVTKDYPFRPHPHKLVGKDGCKNGICTMVLTPQNHSDDNGNMICTFNNLGIQCVKRKEIEESLKLRESKQVDPFRTGFAHAKARSISDIDLSALRLCFQVFIESNGGVGADNGNNPQCNQQLVPIVSDVIHDKKAMSDLVITKLSHVTAPVTGGREIIMLCDKVSRDDIEIRFYEERQGKLIWEQYSEFECHKQVALCIKTPRYYDESIQQPVMVRVQLRRPSDQQVSDPIQFQFLPCESDDDLLSRKRAKIYRVNLDNYVRANIVEPHHQAYAMNRTSREPGAGSTQQAPELRRPMFVLPRDNQMPSYFEVSQLQAQMPARDTEQMAPINIVGHEQRATSHMLSSGVFPIRFQTGNLNLVPGSSRVPQYTMPLNDVPSTSSNAGHRPSLKENNLTVGSGAGPSSSTPSPQPEHHHNQVNVDGGSRRTQINQINAIDQRPDEPLANIPVNCAFNNVGPDWNQRQAESVASPSSPSLQQQNELPLDNRKSFNRTMKSRALDESSRSTTQQQQQQNNPQQRQILTRTEPPLVVKHEIIDDEGKVIQIVDRPHAYHRQPMISNDHVNALRHLNANLENTRRDASASPDTALSAKLDELVFDNIDATFNSSLIRNLDSNTVHGGSGGAACGANDGAHDIRASAGDVEDFFNNAVRDNINDHHGTDNDASNQSEGTLNTPQVSEIEPHVNFSRCPRRDQTSGGGVCG